MVAVGPFLILELDQTKLGRAEQALMTAVTVLNADLDAAAARQVANGAEVVQALLVEYVEHRPSPDDVDEPGPAFL